MNLLSKFFDTRGYKKIDDFTVETKDFDGADRLLFAIFNRNGEFFAVLKVILELQLRYPQKCLLFVVPPQFVPYIRYFFPRDIAIGLNKRNPIRLITTLIRIKLFKADIGLNPWSSGSESEFLISFAKKFSFYKKFTRANNIKMTSDNFYDQIRRYVCLPISNWEYVPFMPKDRYGHILVCPEASAPDRCVPKDKIALLIDIIKDAFSPEKITVASNDVVDIPFEFRHVRFAKTMRASQYFLDCMLEADLVITVDSGPLHLAHLLDKDIVCLFSVTPAQTVLDNGSRCRILREPLFGNKQCKKGSIDCIRPVCVDVLIDREFFGVYTYDKYFQPSDVIVMGDKDCIYQK